MNDILLKAFTDYVLPVVGSAVLAYGGHLLFILKAKLKNDTVKMALDQLAKITSSVVQGLNQTMVAQLKANRTLTKEDMIAIKNKAITMVKEQMQNEFLDVLAKNSIDVDSRIGTEIESQVFEAKAMVCNG
jgi:hypothetical protein